eukprot:COSAG06_NODE_32535_length_504_cov_1.019753_1_plen_131_part_10
MFARAAVENFRGGRAKDELHAIVSALREISCGMMAVGGTAGQALLPYDFLTVILDNCSAMAGKLSGLAVTLQELRLFSFYWLQATGVRGNMGEFFSMINEHCQRHVDEIEFTTADKAAAADEKEHGWDGVP